MNENIKKKEKSFRMFLSNYRNVEIDFVLEPEAMGIIIPAGETYEIIGSLKADDDVTIAFHDSADGIPFFSVNAWTYFEVYDASGKRIHP